MALGPRLYLSVLSIQFISSIVDVFGVHCSPEVVHDWVQQGDLQPANGPTPNQVVLAGTYSNLSASSRLYAAVDPDAKEFLHVRLFLDDNDAVFLVEHGTYFAAALRRARVRFRTGRYRNIITVEHLLRAAIRRPFPFSNRIRWPSSSTGEWWLRASPSGGMPPIIHDQFGGVTVSMKTGEERIYLGHDISN